MTEQRKPIPWYWWTVAVLMLLVAYPLSLGPVYALAVAGYIRHRTAFSYLAPFYEIAVWLPEPINYLFYLNFYWWTGENLFGHVGSIDTSRLV